jgi:hypothetical protein
MAANVKLFPIKRTSSAGAGRRAVAIRRSTRAPREKNLAMILTTARPVFGQACSFAGIRDGVLSGFKPIVSAIQADFRGNWIATVSRDGEMVLKKVGAAPYAQEITPKLDVACRPVTKKK